MSSRLAFLLVLGAVMALGFVAKLATGFRADELQHLHIAWNIGQGLLPFRDFFEHHPPLFHVLLLPLVGDDARVDLPFLAGCAALAMVVFAASVALYRRLLHLAVPPAEAAWGVLLWVLVAPYAFKVYELRPDWLALALLFLAVALLVDAAGREGRRPHAWPAIAGLLWGTSLCLTQKAGFLAVGLALWLSGIVLLAEAGERRRRLALAGAFSIGFCLPVGALVLVFAAQGALDELVFSVVTVNLRWATEIGWRQGLQEGLAWSFALLVLGLVEGARTLGGAAAHLRRASGGSLVALLALSGLLAYATTPVPYPQTFLFVVAPWLVWLGVAAAWRYAGEPAQLRADRWLLAGAALLSGACLLGTRRLPAALLATVATFLLARGLATVPDAARRFRRILAPTLVIGLLSHAVAFVIAFRSRHSTPQASFEAHLDSALRKGEPLLVVSWPVVSPFRRYPVHHWLLHDGVLATLEKDVERIDAELVEALDRGETRLVVVDPALARKAFPRFAERLDEKGRQLEKAPGQPGRVELVSLD